MLKIQNTTFNDRSGFTLIETFVAITILMISILGPLGILAKAFSDANFVQNQVIATNLASEGIELIVARRDFNVYNNITDKADTPFKYLDQCLSSTGCLVDPTIDFTTTLPNAFPEQFLSIKKGTGDGGLSGFGRDIYYYGSASADEKSIFSRTIHIKMINDPSLSPVARIESTVSWKQKNGLGSNSAQSVTMSTYVYDYVY